MAVKDTVVAMADIAVAMADMPQRPTFEEDTMLLVFAAGVVTTLLNTRAATRAMQGAHIMTLAAITGEEATGHIRTTAIRGPALVIMVWAIAIHTMAITVTAPLGGTVRITHIILTDTDTGPI
jgi:NAD(P)-dependent dehydrogenase (short-subunit alcohol dehydrogenase family)